jgi:hypothetical protein
MPIQRISRIHFRKQMHGLWLCYVGCAWKYRCELTRSGGREHMPSRSQINGAPVILEKS